MQRSGKVPWQSDQPVRLVHDWRLSFLQELLLQMFDDTLDLDIPRFLVRRNTCGLWNASGIKMELKWFHVIDQGDVQLIWGANSKVGLRSITFVLSRFFLNRGIYVGSRNDP